MKKMNLIALLLAILVLFSVKTSVAQNTTFKLSDYKNPDYFYQMLDLNFVLNNSLSGNKNTVVYNYSGKSFSFSSQAGGTYTRYINSLKAQGDLSINLNAGVGSNNNNGSYNSDSYKTEVKGNSFGHNESLNLAGLHRFYNQKQNFIEVNGSLSLSNMYNNSSDQRFETDTASSLRENESKDFENSISGSFLIGKGRIEQVQDARMALYLLDDLFVLNREKRSVSDEDVNDLAQLITRLKYKRFFDYRLRNIAEITAIDSFMQKKGIVNTADAVYFTSLNDNWAYANNPVRYSGHRLFTGLEANFGYTRHDETLQKILPDNISNENLAKQKTAGLFMVLGYVYEKPTSLKWQNSATIKGSIGIRKHSENTISRISPDPESELDFYSDVVPALNLSADYGFGYYPSSRTWLIFNWWLSSGWEKQKTGLTKDEVTDSQNTFYASTGPKLQAYYYLSEKLRLSFSFQGQLQFENNKYTYDRPEDSPDKGTRTTWNQALNAQLTYSLF